MTKTVVEQARINRLLNIPLDTHHPLTKSACIDFQSRYEQVFYVQLTFSGFYHRFSRGDPVSLIAKEAGMKSCDVLEIYRVYFKRLFGKMEYEEYRLWRVPYQQLENFTVCPILQQVAKRALDHGVLCVAPHMVMRRNGHGGAFPHQLKTSLYLDGGLWNTFVCKAALRGRKVNGRYDHGCTTIRKDIVTKFAGAIICAEVHGYPQRMFVIPTEAMLAHASWISDGTETELQVPLTDRAIGNGFQLHPFIDAWHHARAA